MPRRPRPPKLPARCHNSPTCRQRVTGKHSYCDSCRELMRLISAIHNDRGDDRGVAGAGLAGCPVAFDVARRVELHRGRVAGLREFAPTTDLR